MKIEIMMESNDNMNNNKKQSRQQQRLERTNLIMMRQLKQFKVSGKQIRHQLYCLVEKQGDDMVYESRKGLPCGYLGPLVRWLFQKQPLQQLWMVEAQVDSEQELMVLLDGVFLAGRVYLSDWRPLMQHPLFHNYLMENAEELSWTPQNFMMYLALLRQEPRVLEQVVRLQPALVQCLTAEQQQQQEELMLTAVISDPDSIRYIWRPSQLVRWAAQQHALPDLDFAETTTESMKE